MHTIMTGLIQETITKAAITKFSGLCASFTVGKRGRPAGGQIKKLTFWLFPLQLSTTKHGKTFLSCF